MKKKRVKQSVDRTQEVISKRLKSKWMSMVMAENGICKRWETFQNFYDWAVFNGYDSNSKIYKMDYEQPFSPENCFIK